MISNVEIQEKILVEFKRELGKEFVFKMEVVTDGQVCLQIQLTSEFKLMPIHYEFIFNSKENLVLDLEIHCENKSKRDLFYDDLKIRSKDKNNEYEWLKQKQKAIIRKKVNFEISEDNYSTNFQKLRDSFLETKKIFKDELETFHLNYFK
jgi:hypothetical protein